MSDDFVKATIVPRSVVSSMTPQEDVCLVSLWSLIKLATEGYDDVPIPMDGWKDSIRLDFDDVTEHREVIILNPEGGNTSMGAVAMNEEQADELLAFIKKNYGSDFIVHCDAGISRSVAVGTFLATHYGYDVKYVKTGDDRHRNIHVLNLLRRAWMKEN